MILHALIHHLGRAMDKDGRPVLADSDCHAETVADVEALEERIARLERRIAPVDERRRVWVVMVEWNIAPSEVTGDPGLVGVYSTAAKAEAAAQAERVDYNEQGQTVHNFTNAPDSHCIGCGQRTEQPGTGVHECSNPDAEEFCGHCGAELKETGSCDNDHDEWDIDLHVREVEIE